jgi:excisionase family DNA binding protein
VGGAAAGNADVDLHSLGIVVSVDPQASGQEGGVTAGLSFPVPDELLEAIAARAAALVAEQMHRERSPWMTRAEAAVYLGVPESRLEKDAAKNGRHEIPFHRDGALVRYHRGELDRWLLDA